MMWIDTRQEMPDDSRSVLIYTTGGGIVEASWSSENEQWVQFRWSAYLPPEKVLYWCELPELQIEFEPVPHGQWERAGEDGFESQCFCCTNCGGGVLYEEEIDCEYDYCPYCGIKMKIAGDNP